MEKPLKNLFKINALLSVIFSMCVAYVMFEHNPQNEFTQNPEGVYTTAFMFFAVFFIILSFQCFLIYKLCAKFIIVTNEFLYASGIGIASFILTIILLFYALKSIST